MRIPQPRSTAKTGTSGRRSNKPRSSRAARPGGAAKGSCPLHHVAEALTGELETQQDQGGRQREQQKAECSALFPIESGDELRIDLLGEPLRVLASEQRRSQIIAESEHENDDATGGDSGGGVRDHYGSQDRESAGAQIVSGLNQ